MRSIFFGILFVWLVGSLICTGLNRNFWPFPSLNVFSELPKDKSGRWVIRIDTDSRKYELDPGQVLPMDFFVARAVVGEIAQKQDFEKLHALLDYIYSHLSESRLGFDERWEKKGIHPGQNTKVQIVLKISKTERTSKYETVPLAELILGEKSYVQ